MSRMLEEIREQPAALGHTLRQELGPMTAFRAIVEKRRPRLIILAARGTSDNAALFGRYLLEITTGIPVSLSAPSVITIYGAELELKDTLVVAISQSGESTDTNLVLERARERGAITAGITNEQSSTLARLAEHVFLVRAGKERSVAATKTYTSQMLLFYLLAWALGGNIRIEDLERLPEWAAGVFKLEDQISELSERYLFMSKAVPVGRGLNYANALEFALKLKETCYVVAEGFSSADFQHGPIAMVDRAFPIFLFAPTGVTWPGIKEMAEKLETLNAETVLITDEGNRDVLLRRHRVLRVPLKLSELYSPIPFIIPAQLFAACLAGHKGLDPDKPRTISKVTRTM